MPPRPDYRPASAHASLGDEFFDRVDPAAFPKHVLRRRNQRWAARVGLDTLTDAEWLTHFGAFQPLPGSFPRPLAMRYHGHQFRSYNPNLGDGRGFLLLRNLVRLAECLLPLSNKAALETALQAFAPQFHRALDRAVLRRLGLNPISEELDSALAAHWWAFLDASRMGFERAFFDWHGGPASPRRRWAGGGTLRAPRLRRGPHGAGGRLWDAPAVGVANRGRVLRGGSNTP